MTKYSSFIESINDIASQGIDNGIVHLPIGKQILSGNKISIKNKELTTFGSCSYLGLELDQRLKDGAIEAIETYGTQFSSSTAYTKVPLYNELEDNFSKLFGSIAIVSQTTTLGHMGTIPIVIDDNDIVILDHQVHNTVQISVNLLKSRGIAVDMIRHNRLDILEEKIKSYRNKYRRIWYMIDGVYSMYGDFAPIKQIEALMNKYEQLSVYVDDAHGMSCYGKNGRGYTLSQIDQHENMIIATSLAKGFGSGGAVFLFKNKKQSELIQRCSLTLMACGPSQPAILGASLASSKIHLSNEVNVLQNKLMRKIAYCNQKIKEAKLPLIANNEGPIFFIGASLPKLATKVIQKTMDDGFYTNYGVFPAVSPRNSGIRFTITNHHNKRDIDGLVESLKHNLNTVLKQENFSEERIYKAFKLPIPVEKPKTLTIKVNENQLLLSHHQTVNNIDQKKWNLHLGKLNMIDSNSLQIFESVYKNTSTKHLNWDFDYISITDTYTQDVILQTFFTTSIVKDDMLSSKEKSEVIEHERLNDPYYMTSKMMMMGTQLTEGNHLFLNKKHPKWKQAIHMLFNKIEKLKYEHQANTLLMRDFDSQDSSLDQLFIAYGFIKNEMPANNIAPINFILEEDFLDTISTKSRRHVRKHILPNRKLYSIEYDKNIILNQFDHCYNLYKNVHEKSKELNTFKLPKQLFKKILLSKNWHVILLREKKSQEIVSILYGYNHKEKFYAKIIGLDYSLPASHELYRQTLYQTMLKASVLGCKQLHFGFTASIEKKKLGAKQVKLHSYSQVSDQFNLEYINAFEKSIKSKQMA